MSLNCICYHHTDGSGNSYQWLNLTEDELTQLQSIDPSQLDAWVQTNANIVETIQFPQVA